MTGAVTGKDYKTLRSAGFSFMALLSVIYWFIAPEGIDLEFHVVRIGELARELARDGFGPVYMFKDMYGHYGYPIPLFYGEIFLYPAALLVMAGLEAYPVYRIMVVAVLWLAFASSHYCVKTWMRIAGYADPDEDICGARAFISAFVYALQPFFLIELFVRASLGAAMAFVFIPFVLLGLYLITAGTDTIGGILYLAGGMAGIIWSHLISAALTAIALAVCFTVVMVRRAYRGRIIKACAAVLASAVICILLTACYLFPMFEQLVQTDYRVWNGPGMWTVSENFFAMLIPQHLSTILSALTHRNIPLSIAGGAVIPFIALVIWLAATGRIRELTATGKALMIIYACLHMLLIVRPLWAALEPVIGFIQFVGRLYLIISVTGAVWAAGLLVRMGDGPHMRAQIIITMISAVYLLIFCFGYFFARDVMPDRMGELIGHEVSAYAYTTEIADDLYIPSCVDKGSLVSGERTVSSDDGNSRDGRKWTYTADEASGKVYLDIEVEDPGSTRDAADTQDVVTYKCPFIMYKGYTAVNKDTGAHYPVYMGDDGMVCFDMPAQDQGHIEVAYTGTATQRVTLIVSMISLPAYAAAVVMKKRLKSVIRGA